MEHWDKVVRLFSKVLPDVDNSFNAFTIKNVYFVFIFPSESVEERRNVLSVLDFSVQNVIRDPIEHYLSLRIFYHELLLVHVVVQDLGVGSIDPERKLAKVALSSLFVVVIVLLVDIFKNLEVFELL